MKETVLVVAPHPDDEVLGPGGTVARFADEGAAVHVVVVTMATPPLYDDEVLRVGRAEAKAAHAVLGVTDTEFLTLPAARLDTVAHGDVNAQLLGVMERVRPELMLIPFNGDMHRDHREVFESALVCARPGTTGAPRTIYAYETLSETNWNAPYLTPDFVPNVFVDISEHLETKLEAMACYRSQLRESPHERSLETLRALATLRGATIGCHAAEAFVLVRDIR